MVSECTMGWVIEGRMIIDFEFLFLFVLTQPVISMQ